MQIRTPKKYRGIQRRSIFPFRRLGCWFFLMALIVIGIGLYQIRGMVQPVVTDFLENTFYEAQGAIATSIAPTATPTEDPTNQLIRADNFWQQGSVDQAVNIYMTTLDQLPNDDVIYGRVTLGLIALGQVEVALDYAEKTVNANPFSPDAWALRAWALDWNGKPGEAIASALYALELIDLQPENNEAEARALSYLAEAYLSAGRPERAENTIEDALETYPDSYEAYRARGLVKWTAFDFDGAIEDFQTALALAPNMTFIAIDIAQIEYSRGNAEEAIALLEDVIEVNPDNTQALYWLGLIYFSGYGDPSQAASHLNRCVDINPDSIGCYYLLGRAQSQLEQPGAAADSFARAIELGSTAARHYWWAGSSQLNIGNRGQCNVYLQTGYELAIEEGDEKLIADYQALMPDCSGFEAPPLETPTPSEGV